MGSFGGGLFHDRLLVYEAYSPSCPSPLNTEMKNNLDQILTSYAALLSSVDRWFARAAEAAGKAVVCSRGCSDCCRGLFDITLLDACLLKRGFDRLPAPAREQATDKALTRVEVMQAVRPDLEHPYILNVWPEDEWEELMPDEDETPCPLLDDDGNCLVYDYRPMTCRLHGLPLIDVSGEVFHDEWCTLNFTHDDPLMHKGLSWEFRELFRDELLLFQDVMVCLLNEKMNELDTFIPTALMIDFQGFDWERWWGENRERVRKAGYTANR